MNSQRRSRLARGNRSLCMESLETRAVLTANLTLLAPLPIEGVESGAAAQAASLNFNITDTVTGGGSVGIDPNNGAFTSQGDLNPLAVVIFDTDNLTFSGGASGAGSVVTQNTTGNPLDDYQVAVFVFDNINVSDFILGSEITAVGSRPLAILARGTMTIAGTIDVSATVDPLSINTTNQRLAGPGGGNGGPGGFPAAPQNGFAALGAPGSPNAFGSYTLTGGLKGGGGGAFGGNGGEGTDPGLAGVAYGNLLVGIQGGSGGASETNDSFPTFILDGGGGGGGVELGATGAISITGSVLANGGNGVFFTNGGGGGGAGGGILVHGTSTVTVSGTLSARGGDSGYTGSGYGAGGGGGGGRIALPLTAITTGATIDVSGGEGAGNIPATAQDGPAGVFTSYTPPAANTSYTYTITWGDGTTTSVVLPVTPGPGGAVNTNVNVPYQYANGGLYEVNVKLEGGSNAPGVFQTGTTGAIIVGSGIDSVTGVLEIVGTNSSDAVQVVKLSSTQLKATYDFGSHSRTVNTSAVTGIQVYLRGGNDVACISSSVTKNAKLFGGDGNDALQGGGGNDVLIGGGGIDLLAGSNGMDLLIGGQGVDALFGENDGDVLVGGDTTLDFNAAALSGGLSGWNAKLATLDAAIAAWSTNQSYSVRRANLDSVLDGDIFDDDDVDVLSGGRGTDLFYRGDQSCFNDLIVDRANNETIFQLDETPS